MRLDLSNLFSNPCVEGGIVDSLAKNDLSGGNYSTPDLKRSGVEAHRSESAHSDRKHGSVEMTNDDSAGNLNNYSVENSCK